MAEERILAPFPDELVEGGTKSEAVAFLVGGRVDAFVDNGVVAVAPLDEVSPHGAVLC